MLTSSINKRKIASSSISVKTNLGFHFNRVLKNKTVDINETIRNKNAYLKTRKYAFLFIRNIKNCNF